ncbi:hypothetical protein SRB5_17420 [Streptomyces sp. RB5]|uniref:Uncharacterized protein n=1 Tax=Streptomyces smaragdinus TaxID=2585196 RepID=A0A7K0CE60_9ACTN|nr:hypothetical protein [Streptomyces smaragdinus]MQY11623.1 hypothetical protein [Streptomyces smaragdinus]
MTNTDITTERVQADGAVVRHLGNWTTAGRFEVRARRGNVVLDLRSAGLPAEVSVELGVYRSTVKLLVPEGAEIDHWDLAWEGSGRVKDAAGPTGEPGLRITITGTAARSEVRINRGGVAALSAMLTREYLRDLKQARREGRYPTIDDPARDPRPAKA